MLRSVVVSVVMLACLGMLGSAGWGEEAPSEVLINNVFVDTSIKAALGDLALASGFTIIPDHDLSGTVNLDLRDVPFEEALRRVLMGVGAVYSEIAEGVYLVGTGEPTSATFNLLATTEVVSLDYLTSAEALRQLPLPLQTYVREGPNHIVITAAPTMVGQIRSILEQVDRPPTLVVIEAVVLEVSKTAAQSLGLQAFWGATRETGTGTAIGPDFFERVGGLGSGEAYYTLGRLRGKIGDLEVGIDALVERGDAKIHANPRIVTTDGRLATMQAGSDVYVTILTGPDAYRYAQMQLVKTGVILEVTPHVARNGDITLDIAPEVSGIVPGSSRLLSNVNLEVMVRRAETRARVKSGETIAIGGLLQELTSETRTKVPLLGDLPIVGPLFQSKSASTTETELIILITPYLYDEGTAEVSMGPIMQEWAGQRRFNHEQPPEQPQLRPEEQPRLRERWWGGR